MILLSGAAAGLAAAQSDAHHQHADAAGSTPQALAERQRLLAEGESRLRAGDAEGARQAFEQAALQAHEARIELGILRAQMQSGEYRHALAFAAHTAGVHLDEVQGRVFYAWLLNLGAQEALATQTLAQAEAAAPDAPMVKALRLCLDQGEGQLDGVLLSEPARLAPFASGAVVPPGTPVQASALLLSDGRYALAPSSALAANSTIWLRNGLGQTVAAEPVQAAAVGMGVVLLKLAAPLPVPEAMVVPARDAFPGSPALGLNYAHDSSGEAAWPLMRLGFLGAPTLAQATGWHRLGIRLPGSGARGGPVYDQGGRLLGLAMRGEDGVDVLVPSSALRAHFGERFGSLSVAARPDPLAPDELYERAMRVTLQVLVSKPAAQALN